MDQVNNNVKEAVDTTNYVLHALAHLWHSLPREAMVFVLVMLITSILMEWVKKSFFMSLPKKDRINRLWRWGMPIGWVVTAGSAYLFKGLIPLGWWVGIGVTVSTAAMVVHLVSMKYVLPLIQAVFTWIINRVYILITGKPRSPDNGNG